MDNEGLDITINVDVTGFIAKNYNSSLFPNSWNEPTKHQKDKKLAYEQFIDYFNIIVFEV